MLPRKLILLIAESLDEALLIQRRLQAAGILNPIYSLHEISQARQFLAHNRRTNPRPSAPEVMLIGPHSSDRIRPLIHWIRNSPTLAHLPIVAIDPHSPFDLALRIVSAGTPSLRASDHRPSPLTQILASVQDPPAPSRSFAREILAA